MMNLYFCRGCFRGPQFLATFEGVRILGVQQKTLGYQWGGSALGALLKVGKSTPWVFTWWKKHGNLAECKGGVP